MTFGDKLNEYMRYFDCTPKKLVSLSGVSAATISRYRSGAREPSPGSPILENIARGLSLAEAGAGREDLSYEQIYTGLVSLLGGRNTSYDRGILGANLDMLISRLHLNASDISDHIGMERSRFFRIRTGQGRPNDINDFCADIGRYIFGRLGDDSALDILSDILGCMPSELDNEDAVCARITELLMGDDRSLGSHAMSFLRELDHFDTGDRLYAEKDVFTDMGGEAEKSFISAVLQSDTDTNAIICADLYTMDSDDGRELKMLGFIISTLVRKGVCVDLVLNADNPMDEILPALVSLMPMFMSGKVSAFYLKGRRDGVYRYTLVSLGNAALCREAIAGHNDTAMTHVAVSSTEISVYRRRAKQILSLASPLIEIIDSSEKRTALLAADAAKKGMRYSVFSTPPLFTISDELLGKILDRNNADADETERIRQYIHTERSRIEKILKHSGFICAYPEIPHEVYDENPVFLSLSGLLYGSEILCTYDEYSEHVQLMKKFEKEYGNFHCVPEANSSFRNVQIFSHSGQWVMLSKNRTPPIHLFIKHSKLRQALEDMLDLSGGYYM